MVAFTGNSIGDTATYSCNLGFELIGATTVTCTQVDMNSASFQLPETPSCRREYCMNVTRVAASLPNCATDIILDLRFCRRTASV